MQSGALVLDQIARQLSAAEAGVARAGSRVRQLRSQEEQLRGEETRALARLAAVRLGELAASRIRSELDAADERALGLLARRQEVREQLQREVEQSTAALLQLGEHRRQALAARDDAAAAHRTCANDALHRLSAEEAYQVQRGHVEHLTAQAEHADAKAVQSEADREQKRKPYERDKLFAYLWRRRYRFPEYRAWPLFRSLDGWVARLCRYDEAHRDYGMLLAIPVRLRQHATAVAATASTAANELAAMEQAALAAAGAPALAEALRQRQLELDDIGARIEAAEAAHDELLQRQAECDAGNDPHSRQALQTIETQLQSEDLVTLQRDALATPTAADDELVRAIASLREHVQQLQREREQAEIPHQQAQQALAELQDLRRRFRQHDFDAEHSVFDPGLDLGGLLAAILGGGLRAAAGWNQLRRHQRFRSAPSTSSGAQIAGQILGSLLSSSSRSSSSRSGGMSGGGFRSGGGIGGGGFRSGGGFGGGGGGFRTGGGF